MEGARNKLQDMGVTNDVSSAIDYSGNSDVDIEIIVDTMPIAYAMLSTLLATGQMSEFEFKRAVRQLEDLADRGKSPVIREMNDVQKVKLNRKRLN